MFPHSYFPSTYFAPTYFGPAVIVKEGGGGKTKKKTKKELKQELIAGYEAFYGEPEINEVKSTIENLIEDVVNVPELPELETIPYDYLEKLEFNKQIKLLESKAEINKETLARLEEEQDIGLILAIIEAIDY